MDSRQWTVDSGSEQPARQSPKGGDGWTVARPARWVSRLVSRVSWYVALVVALGTWHVERVSAQQLSDQELPAAITSREVSPRFRTLTMEDGLSQGGVYDMFQDSRGFMWFATQDGLNRWDGYDVEVFKHQPFDSTTLTSSWLYEIDEDADGNLWLAGRGGLNRMDARTGKVTAYTHDPDDPNSLSTNEAYNILVATDGAIWVGSDLGLDRLADPETGVFKHFRHDPDDSTSLSHDQVWAINEDSQGRIWAGGPNGLSRIDDPATGKVRRYFDIEDTLGCGPTTFEGAFTAVDIFERPDDPEVLWVSTERGLARLDPESGEFTLHPIDDGSVCGGLMFSPVQDPQNPGVIWGSRGGNGIARFDIRTESYKLYNHDKESGAAIPGEASRGMFVDRSGVIWIGTPPDGVTYFDPSSIGVDMKTSETDDPNSLIGPAVTSVWLSRDGILWVISSSADEWGLSALDRANGTAKHYRHNPNDPSSISDGNYWGDITEDLDGFIWVLTPRSLDRLDRRTGRFKHYVHDDNDESSPAADGGQAIMVDRAGAVWIGHRGSISRLNRGSQDKFIRYVGEEGNEATVFPTLVRGLSEDRNGFIWAAQDGGVSRVDPISGRVKRFHHVASDPNSIAGNLGSDIHERAMEPGVMWIASYGGGLDRLDVESGNVRHFTEREGLSNNGVYGILEDDQGRLWMSTNRGISRFDPQTETFRNYGMEIGLQGLEFNSGAMHRGFQGEFFFGGNHGLNSFFPNELSENSKAPQVTLVDMKLFNKSIAETGAVKLDKRLDQTEEIALDYDQRDIEFDFVAFHYANPGGNEYAYKLDGFNDDWVDIGNKRTASFTNLDPGEYTFHVKAANSDGVWNEEGTSIRLVIEPPFWATWWFRTLAILLFGGVIVGGYRLRTRQLESRARALEDEVGKRTSELRSSNEQLEQSHTIVKTINQETSFRRLLTKILEEARVMPGVEKATAIIYMPAEGVFRVRASSGWDVEAMSDIALTDRQARKRYVANSEQVGEEIFVCKNVGDREGAEEMAEFGQVASFMVLRIMVEDEVAGYLVFDNLTDPDAFDDRDVELLERLREHIQSAFIKTRILEDLRHTLDDLRSTQDRLVQSEKMASLGELTAGIAHEIKNPLNFVNNFAEVTAELIEEAQEAESPERLKEILSELKENAKRIEHHAKRADGIVENMMHHASGSGSVEPTDINDLLDEYVSLTYHGFKAKHPDAEIKIEKNLDKSLRKLDVIPQDLGKVFMNLLSNAFDALAESGKGEREKGKGSAPTVTVSTAKNGTSVEIRIADNGPGIPANVREKIFEPFFTTKPTGSGTGLGLSMSYDIVTKGHGGELNVESEPGEGATFIIRLPA